MTSNKRKARRVVEGCKLPHDGPITANERTWIEFIRLTSCDTDPPPTLARVQALRELLRL